MQELVALIQNAVMRIIAALKGNTLGSDRPRRFLVINITATVANGVAPVESPVQLDREFNKITGIGFFEVNAGGIAGNYNVGARSNRRTWIDDININAWNANSGVGPNNKYYSTDIDYGSGDTFIARLIPNTAPVGVSVVGQMVLILEKSLTELPK